MRRVRASAVISARELMLTRPGVHRVGYMSGLRLKPPQGRGRGVWIWRDLSGKAAAGRAGVAAAMEMVK